ncbi:hypothetical protein PAMP_001249 [Pampus punctatissimus]
MAQADSKVLVLGALAGVAGIGLAVVCYQGFRSRRRGSWPAFCLNRNNEQATSVMLMDGPGLAGGQAVVLERLEALIQCVSELKDEMKALKDALPTLPDQVREELRGHDGAEARRSSPFHRTTPTRRKRAAGTITGARAGGRSSEEAESEGGYMTALTDSEEEELSDAEPGDKEQPADKLSVLLEKIDRLHQGTDSEKRESLNILLEQREEDHLDKAIELKPQDPMSYYLLGRWCYAVAQLSWIERKVAATLFGEPPSATVEDALKNFLKVEEIHPGYSKLNYVFLAKCYKDLGQSEKARRMCEAACSMNAVSKEDEEAQKELDLLCPMLGV